MAATEMTDPRRHPREGWEESFAEMAELGDDRLLDAETETEWDRTGWEW